MSKFSTAVLSVALLLCVLFSVPVSAQLVELNPENYEKIVNDPTKNVFVMFYAPWCGHCNAMKPTWSDLAGLYPISGDVVIARVDASMHRDIARANDIKGFPTIKMFTKQNKRGVEYNGPRDVSAFKLFIKNNS